METIYYWTIQRSGGSMTLLGRTGDGAPIKITNVVYASASPDGIQAVVEGGRVYALAPDMNLPRERR